MTQDQRPYRLDEYTPEIVAETLTDGSVVYVATYPELDGCMAHGETEQEARENLAEAFEIVIDHLRTFGLPIPEPRHSPVERTVVQSYVVSNQSINLTTMTASIQPMSFSGAKVTLPVQWLQSRLSVSLAPATLAEAS